MKRKTYYYSDLLNDDFAGYNLGTNTTPADFEYLPHSPLFKFFGFILYFCIAKPFTWLYVKIAYHQKYVNKKVLREARGKGKFFFGNHTLEAGDAYIPNHLGTRRNYIVAGPDATSIKGIKTIVKMLGALPVPSTVTGTRNFISAIDKIIDKGQNITVYPEAHIWPGYTKIRPFKADSFSLPITSGAPSFSFTNVYLKSRVPFIKRPVIKTFIDGPFYPDPNLTKREQVKDLRDRIYESMVRESEKQEQYITIDYVEKEPQN